MSKIGVKFVDGGKVFSVDTTLTLEENQKVVVESVRGLEIATTCKAVNDDGESEVKNILRLATDDDLKKAEELKKQVPKITKITNELIAKYKLDMKLVDVTFTLDGTKVIINYVCEDRVDFRELVKDLASQLKLRIELRQIGIRDQAKILGGIGLCGKECCCKRYLNDFDKVSIKMAKTQGLSLNPTKISGICGRLMCCLAYENDFYSEIATKMPKLNSKVSTKDGIGTVVYNNLLKQMVTVRIENENEIKVCEYPLSEISIASKMDKPYSQKQDETNKGTRVSFENGKKDSHKPADREKSAEHEKTGEREKTGEYQKSVEQEKTTEHKQNNQAVNKNEKENISNNQENFSHKKKFNKFKNKNKFKDNKKQNDAKKQ